MSLSQYGNCVAVSGWYGNSVRIYDTTGTENWTLRGEVILDGTGECKSSNPSDCYAPPTKTIALSRNCTRVAVGSPFSGIGNRGKVRIFMYKDESRSYEQLGGGIMGEGSGDYTGSVLYISDAGDMVAIGECWNGNSTGRVRVFRFVDDNWKNGAIL